ncbi:hypothetical protein [Actinomadura rifamycini]|uniref:hypothetical protein n=1 Tax=Actinomadura rifamycini TaxID=31962 RepID=UPI0012FA9655|nr:hypothetical protein [Actinomadura rifamycini]
MSGSHRSGDDRDSYRGPGGGPSGGHRADGGGYGTGGSGERAVRPGTGGYPEDPLTSPIGSPTSGYPTVGGGSETGRYSSGRYSSGGPPSGGYDTGGYATGGYGTGGYATGGYATGGYSQASGSGQYTSGAQGSGGYAQGGGGYGQEPAGSASGGYPQADDSGRYASGARYPSGGYERTSGTGGRPQTTGSTGSTGSTGYEADAGRYADSRRSDGGGEYARGARSPRDSSGRGGYRTGTGSHRIVREERRGRRWGIVLAGACAGIAACVLAVFVVMSGSGTDGGDGTGRIVGSGASESASAGTTEFTGVPDSCTIVDGDLIKKLAPDAERDEADNYQGNDRQTQCVWGVYTGDQKRQLTVELRAVEPAGGQPAAAAAQRTYAAEQKADEAGEALLAGQELTDKRRLDGVGDEGYVVYSVDDQHGTGEAIANVRFVNVLVTIHYGGSAGDDPLSYDAAGDGAVEVVEAVLAKLAES